MNVCKSISALVIKKEKKKNMTLYFTTANLSRNCEFLSTNFNFIFYNYNFISNRQLFVLQKYFYSSPSKK